MPEEPSSYRSRTQLPLRGKTVLVTRPREQAGEFIKLLEQLGASVTIFPTIEIVPPPSWDACDEAIRTINTFDGLLFTSANGVTAFVKRVQRIDRSLLEVIRNKPIYAVGTKTQAALAQYDLPAAGTPELFDTNHLAETLASASVSGKRFLFPKGNLAGNELAAAVRRLGAEIVEVVVYATVAPSGVDTAELQRMLTERKIDIIAFFSPSSVQNLLGLVSIDALQSVLLAAIGASTARAIRNASLEVHIIAEQSTAAGLAAAIVKYCE